MEPRTNQQQKTEAERQAELERDVAERRTVAPGVEPEAAHREPVPPEGRERKMRSLARELVGEVSALTTAEVTLAKTEIQEKVSQAERGIAAMASGAAVLAAGLLAILAGLILLLATVWPDWLSALVIGAVVALIGTGLLMFGKPKVSPDRLKPEQTTRSLQEGKEFAQRQTRQATEAWR